MGSDSYPMHDLLSIHLRLIVRTIWGQQSIIVVAMYVLMLMGFFAVNSNMKLSSKLHGDHECPFEFPVLCHCCG